TSRDCSKWAMRLLTAGWVRCSRTAAAEKLPQSAMATNAERLAQSTIKAPDAIPHGNPLDEKYAFELSIATRQDHPQPRAEASASPQERGFMAGKTLYGKLWEMHEVTRRDDGSSLIYIDRHILHEVTSPLAFEGLRLAGRTPWRVDANIATPDHNVPTTRAERAGGLQAIADPVSRLQVQTLDENCDDFGILQFKMDDARQGIVHVVGPEQGATLPGMTVVCGDSHTSTHGAFGALAHGIGTSEVEHVLATQCLVAKKMKNMQVRVEGTLPAGVTAKDIVLAIIGHIGTAGGNGHALEFAGSAIRELAIEGRMTLCNMAIEAGARVGMVAVDEKTIEYVRGRPFAPRGADWDAAVALWKTLVSDAGAHFDTVVELRAEDIRPQVSWGTSPEMVLAVDQAVPD